MRNRIIYALLLLSCFALFSTPVISQGAYTWKYIADLPGNARLVNDLADVLTTQEENEIEEKLFTYEKESSNEIAVVIVDTLNGLTPAVYANELGKKWNIGKAEKKNGVVFLISIKDRALNISPGYNLQGALPDILCGRIIRDVVVPSFRAGNIYEGVSNGSDAIISATKGEFKGDGESGAGQVSAMAMLIIFGLFILFLFFLIKRSKQHIYVSRKGYKRYDDDWPGGGWFGGGFGGGSWGSGGGFGGGGGGGFGGFGGGGGGFNGGGASGSW